MNQWLVTGATGLLGSNASRQIAISDSVTCSARSAPANCPLPFFAADLADAGSIDGIVARTGAKAVFHAAAVASIEAASSDPLLAHRINVEAAAELAAQANREGAAFVYVSTDAVFDGREGDYSENAPTSPESEYGRSKVRGEQAVLEANPRALIARVNFYGWSPTGKRSLAEFFHSRLEQGITTPGFVDVKVSTLEVSFLVKSIVDLVSMNASGIVNVASQEPTTKFDFGRNLAIEFGFDPALVTPSHSAEHLTHTRGSNLTLRTELISELLGRSMATQQMGLRRLHDEFDAGLPELIRRFDSRNGS